MGFRRKIPKEGHVDDYHYTKKPRPPKLKFLKETEEKLLRSEEWLTTRNFFLYEVKPILDNRIKLTGEQSTYRDFLFEYLVIRSVTILENQLLRYCSEFVNRFPEKAELLLKQKKENVDLSLQILTAYPFTNLRNIHHVFSTLIGKDFFHVLRHRSEERQSSIGYERDHIYRASPLFKQWEKFEELIDLRNKLVHHNIPIRIKSKNDKKNLLSTIYDVNFLTSLEGMNLPYDNNAFDTIIPDY